MHGEVGKLTQNSQKQIEFPMKSSPLLEAEKWEHTLTQSSDVLACLPTGVILVLILLLLQPHAFVKTELDNSLCEQFLAANESVSREGEG